MKKMMNALMVALVLTVGFSFAAAPAFAEKMQEKCPVMGYAINKKLYADHDGKRVYFCCPSCDAKFKKNPEKYIKELEAKGVVLEKTPE